MPHCFSEVSFLNCFSPPPPPKPTTKEPKVFLVPPADPTWNLSWATWLKLVRAAYLNVFPPFHPSSSFLISPHSLTLKIRSTFKIYERRGEKKELMVCYFYSVSRLLIWYDLSQRRWNNKLYLLLLKTKPLVSHVAASLCFFNSYLQNSTRRIFRTSVALRNQYAFISFHSVLFQLGIFFFHISRLKICFWTNKKGSTIRRFHKIYPDSQTRPLIVRWCGDHKGLCPRAEAEVRHLLLFPTFSLADEFPVWLSSWQHPNFAASEDWALTAPHWSIPAGVFLHTEAGGEGVKVKVWHRATDLQQQRPLLPGWSRSATWPSQVASDLTSTLRDPVGRQAEMEKNERIGQTWLEERMGMEEGEIVGGRRETKCSEIGQPVSHFSC